MSAVRLSFVLVSTFVLACVGVGCGSPDDDHVCMRGATRPCSCAGRGQATQVCADDQLGWTPCECEAPPDDDDAGDDDAGDDDIETCDGNGSDCDDDAPDTSPPVIEVLLPEPGQLVGLSVEINVRVTDETGVDPASVEAIPEGTGTPVPLEERDDGLFRGMVDLSLLPESSVYPVILIVARDTVPAASGGPHVSCG